VVALGAAGLPWLHPSGDGLAEATPPLALPGARAVASAGEVLYAAGGGRVARWRGGVVSEAALESRPRHLEASAEGAMLSLGDRGVAWWDGTTAPQVDSMAPLDGRFDARASALVDADTAWITGAATGLVRARREGGRWVGEAALAGGGVEEVALSGETIALVIDKGRGQGALALLDARDRAITDRLDVQATILDIAASGEALLVATRERPLLAVDLGAPPGQRRLEPAAAGPPLRASQVAARGPAPAVILEAGAGLAWIERGEGGWAVRAREALALGINVGDLLVDGDAALALYLERGHIERAAPGAPHRRWDLAGVAAESAGRRFLTATLTAFGGAYWAGVPALGLERISPGLDERALLRLPDGAWGAVGWGGEVAVALGVHGVGIVAGDPMALTARCDLPGQTRRLLAVGDALMAASGGAVFFLERAP